MIDAYAIFRRNIDNVAEMIRQDLDKPVCQWSKQDLQDWRDMGWRKPVCKCEKCKSGGVSGD